MGRVMERAPWAPHAHALQGGLVTTAKGGALQLMKLTALIAADMVVATQQGQLQVLQIAAAKPVGLAKLVQKHKIFKLQTIILSATQHVITQAFASVTKQAVKISAYVQASGKGMTARMR
jgi:hypothetical protein